MIRWSLLFVFTLFFIRPASAQDKLSGRVYENKTRFVLPGIKIENLQSRQTTVTDSAGDFTIRGKVGDKIAFSGFSYIADTVYIVNLKYLEVYLDTKVNMLKEVKVLTPEIKTGSLSAPPATGPFGSRSVQYQTDGAGNYIGGIKLMVHDWDNDKKKRRDSQIAADVEKEKEINGIFNPQTLKSYLPLKGQEMENFIILYTPDVKTYTSVKFNLVAYLNTCYGSFLKIPTEKRQSKSFLRLTTNAAQ